jgi:hypothetical protein
VIPASGHTRYEPWKTRATKMRRKIETAKPAGARQRSTERSWRQRSQAVAGSQTSRSSSRNG